MSYRKITVDGKDYLYTVGKTHVKIHGMQAVPIEQIAAPVHGNRWAVTPLRIATYIKMGYVPQDTPTPNILEQETVAKMRNLERDADANGDWEKPHMRADGLLCDVLLALGYRDLVEAYNSVPKWFA